MFFDDTIITNLLHFDRKLHMRSKTNNLPFPKSEAGLLRRRIPPCCLTPEPPKKRKVTLNPIDDLRYDNISHWPDHIEPKKRCRNCITAYTRTGCLKCKISLCLAKTKNCFVMFHTK